jgi:hypothetical protein
MAAKLTKLTYRIAIQLHFSGRELYHLRFPLQVASPETSEYTLVHGICTVQYLSIQSRFLCNKMP